MRRLLVVLNVVAALGAFEYFCSPHPWMRARVTVMMD
jgi:plastocyanin